MAKSAVPNFFTFSNLACGVLSLMMTIQHDYKWACLFILIAGFIDRYDGRVARFLNVSSDLGKELDSLADLVSFGVAPSILVCYIYNFTSLGIIGYLLVTIFPISGAYRLARYNATTFNDVFTGVPITIAGAFLAFYSLVYLSYKPNFVGFNTGSVLVLGLLLLLSFLMISKFKFKKV
jgi:CDP-diacylglycerol---serine O-phosphatidyltransferase